MPKCLDTSHLCDHEAHVELNRKHTRSNIRREDVEERIKDYENCVECQRNADEDDAERIWKQKRKDRGGYRHDD